jgi:hypothetical protein
MSWKKLAGAALGFALAPATGGLSLKLAATGLGATLGGAFDEATGGGASGAARDAANIQSAAADRAAELQRQTAQEQLALQREMYERNIGLQEPFRQSGLAAQNQLLTLLGIRPQQAPEAPRASGGGGFGGVAGMIGNVAANAMRQQQGPGLQVDPNSPDFGRYARDFGMSDFQADPGYAFRMSEGMKGLERSAAARGGLLSGGTLKGIQRFGQDLASQEYTNAFNRYQTNRAAQLNPLQSLAGVGQTTANTLGQAGENYASQSGATSANLANTLANLGMTAGATQGNALLAGQQARSSSYGQLGSALGKYLGGGGTFGMGGGGTFQADPGAYAFGTQYWE